MADNSYVTNFRIGDKVIKCKDPVLTEQINAVTELGGGII